MNINQNNLYKVNKAPIKIPRKSLSFALEDRFIVHFTDALKFFAAKMLKITILTSVWRAQHPNTGRNIQHPFPCHTHTQAHTHTHAHAQTHTHIHKICQINIPNPDFKS